MEKQFNLTKGTWLVGDCARHDEQCKMKFIAPESQRKELEQTIIQHAKEVHDIQDAKQLKLNNLIEKINV